MRPSGGPCRLVMARAAALGASRFTGQSMRIRLNARCLRCPADLKNNVDRGAFAENIRRIARPCLLRRQAAQAPGCLAAQPYACRNSGRCGVCAKWAAYAAFRRKKQLQSGILAACCRNGVMSCAVAESRSHRPGEKQASCHAPAWPARDVPAAQARTPRLISALKCRAFKAHAARSVFPAAFMPLRGALHRARRQSGGAFCRNPLQSPKLWGRANAAHGLSGENYD